MRVNGAEVDELLTDAVNRERERCAKLVTLRADICRASARAMRNAGTFTGSSLHLTWPFIRHPQFVAGKWEARAREMEAVADAFDMVARVIRDGIDPEAKING